MSTLTRRNFPAVFKALREYIDGQVSTLTASITAKGVLTGELKMWGGSAAPSGYYLCDGSAKNTTTDAALFAVIGYTYGGSGASFNLPNFTNKFPRGGGPSTGGGADTHTHTSAAHSHTLSNAGQAQIAVDAANGGVFSVNTSASFTATRKGAATVTTVSLAEGSATPLQGSTDSATPGATGSSSNVPVYTGVNFIIKA